MPGLREGFGMGGRCHGNVGQGNRDNAMSFIPLTFIPLPSAPAAWKRLSQNSALLFLSPRGTSGERTEEGNPEQKRASSPRRSPPSDGREGEESVTGGFETVSEGLFYFGCGASRAVLTAYSS